MNESTDELPLFTPVHSLASPLGRAERWQNSTASPRRRPRNPAPSSPAPPAGPAAGASPAPPESPLVVPPPAAEPSVPALSVPVSPCSSPLRSQRSLLVRGLSRRLMQGGALGRVDSAVRKPPAVAIAVDDLMYRGATPVPEPEPEPDEAHGTAAEDAEGRFGVPGTGAAPQGAQTHQHHGAHEQRRAHLEKNHRRAKPPVVGAKPETNVLPSTAEREWRADARSIAVALVQRLGRNLVRLEPGFRGSDSGGLKAHEFVRLVSLAIRDAENDPSSPISPRPCGGKHTGGRGKHRGAKGEEQTEEQDDAFDALQVAVGLYASVQGLSQSDTKTEDRSNLVRERDADLVIEWTRLSGQRDNPMHSIDFFRDGRMMEWSLAELFATIDIDDTDCVSWEDFVAFIIDATMQGRHGHAKEAAIRHYERVELPSDTPAGLCGLRRACFSEELDRMVILGHDNLIRLVSPDMVHGFRVVQCYPWQPSMGRVMSLELYTNRPWEAGFQLAVSTSDAIVRIYDAQSTLLRHTVVVPTEGLAPVRQRRGGTTQTALSWGSRTRELLCGSRQGRIVALRFQHEEDWIDDDDDTAEEGAKYGCARRERIRPTATYNCAPHTDAIMDILQLPDGAIVAASLDSTISVRNPMSAAAGGLLRGHSRGVFSVSYSPQYNFLASAGYEPQPFLWVTNVRNFRPFRLRDSDRPHCDRLLKVHCVQGSPQLLSMDRTGMIKVWDIRTFASVQTLNCVPEHIGKKEQLDDSQRFAGFIYLEERRSVLTAGGLNRELHLFDYRTDEPLKTKAAADEHPVSAVVLLPKRGRIVTAGGKGLKWWVSSGTMERAFPCLTTDVITVACAAGDETRVYAGAHNGTIVVQDMTSGVVLHRYVVHHAEVTLLIYMQPLGCVLSSSCGGALHFIVDTPKEQGPTGSKQTMALCTGAMPRVDAASASYSPQQELLVTGENHNSVAAWRCCMMPVDEEDEEEAAARRAQQNDVTVHWLVPPIPYMLKKFKGNRSKEESGRRKRREPRWQLLARSSTVPVDAVCTAVAVLDPYPAFAAADSAGGLHIWGLRGSTLSAAAHWVSHHPDGCQYTPVVRVLQYDPVRRFLYAASNKGYVTITALSALLVDCHGATPREEDELSAVRPDAKQPKLFSLPRGDSLHRIRMLMTDAVMAFQHKGRRVSRRKTTAGMSSDYSVTVIGSNQSSPAGRGPQGLHASQESEEDEFQKSRAENEARRIFDFNIPPRSAALANVPTQVCFWRAHQGECSALVLCSGPRCVFTAGSEGRVRIWSMWGRLLGTLVHGAVHQGHPVDPRKVQAALYLPQEHSPRKQGLRFSATSGPLAGDLRGLLQGWGPPEAEDPVSAAAAEQMRRDSQYWGEDQGSSEDESSSSCEDVPGELYDDVPPPWGHSAAGPLWGFAHAEDTTRDVAAQPAATLASPAGSPRMASARPGGRAGSPTGRQREGGRSAVGFGATPGTASRVAFSPQGGAIAPIRPGSPMGSMSIASTTVLSPHRLPPALSSLEQAGQRTEAMAAARHTVPTRRPLVESKARGGRGRAHAVALPIVRAQAEVWSSSNEMLFLSPEGFVRATSARAALATGALAAAAACGVLADTGAAADEDQLVHKRPNTFLRSLEGILDMQNEVSARRTLDLCALRPLGEPELQTYRDWVGWLTKATTTESSRLWRPWEPPPPKLHASQDFSRPSRRLPDPQPAQLLAHQHRFPRRRLDHTPAKWTLQVCSAAYMKPTESRSLSPGAVFSPKWERAWRQLSAGSERRTAGGRSAGSRSPIASPNTVRSSRSPSVSPPPRRRASLKSRVLMLMAAGRMARAAGSSGATAAAQPPASASGEGADEAGDKVPRPCLAGRLWHRCKATPRPGEAERFAALVDVRARAYAAVPYGALCACNGALVLLAAAAAALFCTPAQRQRLRRAAVLGSAGGAVAVLVLECAKARAARLPPGSSLLWLGAACRSAAGKQLADRLVASHTRAATGEGAAAEADPLIRPLRRTGSKQHRPARLPNPAAEAAAHKPADLR